MSGGGSLGSLRPFLRLVGPQRRLLALAVLSGFVHHASAIAAATTGAYLVGLAVTGASVADLQAGLIALAVLLLPQGIAPWLETQLAHVAAFRVLADVRGKVYAAFDRLAPGYLIEHRSGDLGSTAVSDVEQLETFFAHTLSPLVVACTVPLGALIALSTAHWALPLALVPVLILLAWVPAALRRHARVDGDRVRAALGEVGAEAVDGIQGMREVVSFGAGTRQLEKLARATGALAAAKHVHADRAGREQAATDVLATLGILVILMVAAILVSTGRMAFPEFPAAVVLAAFTFRPVIEVTDVARELNVAAAAGRRIESLLNTPAPVRDLVTETPPRPITPHVTFHEVSFRYRPTLPDAVSGATFEVGPGETVALVGRSGAGKSTLTHLLLRFWDVTRGAITIGGYDVRDMPQETVRELITSVSQDIYLFNVSMADNIRLGHPGATRRDVEEAARAALAHDFITALPEGYDTVAGELGRQLSGGQRQRIAIARALLRNSPVLVMDEAVSNLDVESELALQDAMARAQQGRTTLVVAHRLSTIRAADRIVLLDEGTVTESGTHEQLMNGSGGYAELVAAQDADDK